MVAEQWIINVAGIIFSIIAALIVIIKIFPRIGDLASNILGENNSVASLMSLLVILVYILLFTTIIGLLKNIDNKYLNYVTTIDPGINLVLALLPYLKWVVFALLLGLSLKQLKK